MTQGTPETSVADMVAKEEWAESTASWITNNVETKVGPIEYDIALKAARFTSLWIDEFTAICKVGGEDATGSPKDVIMRARGRALEKTQGIDRYPTGEPTLKTIIASNYAFALTFNESERQQVLEILFGPPVEEAEEG
jgi:hypothetical protein